MSNHLDIWVMAYGDEVLVRLDDIVREPAEQPSYNSPGYPGCIYFTRVMRQIDGKWTDVSADVTDSEWEKLQGELDDHDCLGDEP